MLDEPAAGLNPKETKELDELIAELSIITTPLFC
jgi:branched-chain amino acid transport system ATP-binding protein